MLSAALVGLGAAGGAVRAQDFPTKPIRLVVPFPAGGGTDVVSRVLSQAIAADTRWTFLIDNKPGVGGALGVEAAARAQPDGYTIVMGQTSNLALAPGLNSKLPYDPVKDLQPITLVASGPLVLVASSGARFKTLAELIAIAKAEPGKLMIGSPGNGTLGHLGGELFQSAVGVKLEHIPYKGAAQALTDVLGGRLDIYVSTVPAALTQIRSGRLRGVVTLAGARHPDLPDAAVVSEIGVPAVEVANWYGLLVPAATPKAIVERIAGAVGRALQSPDIRAKYAAEGLVPTGGTPDQFAAHMATEIAKWGKAIKASGIKMQ